MKNKTLTLTIDKPCSENWNSFTPVTGGGFCSSCSKVVIDFTKASDEEIFEFIQQKPAHACGRFRASQLKTYSDVVPSSIRPGFIVMKAGLLSLLLLLISKPGTAQSTQPKATQEMIHNAVHSTSIADTTKYLVKGIVRTKEDGSALPGVSVVLKGSAIGTQTDENGKFEFQQVKAGDVLCFYYLGFTSKEIKIRDHEQLTLELEMDMDMMTLGEISIAEPYTPKQSILKKTWSKFKQLF